MHAMILAAGLGTRLGALGAATPKILIEVGGRPLLQRHLDYLHENGINAVAMNTHHQAVQIERFVAEYDGPVDVVCVHEDRLLGTAGGVRNALPQLGPGPFVVMYGDILVQEPIREMLDRHLANDALATLAVHEAESIEGKGTVEIDERGRVTRFVEKSADSVASPALINSGIYVLEREVVEELPSDEFFDFGADIFPQLLERGAPIDAYRLDRPVIDIGTPDGLSLANAIAT